MAVEFEKFEITDQDLEDEFNPDRRRPYLSKKQHLYGVFADDSDNEEGPQRPSFSRKDYTNPVNFIGGGSFQAGKKGEKKEEAEDEEDDDDAGSIPRGSSSDEEELPRKSISGRNAFGRKGATRRNAFPGFRTKKEDFGGWESHTKGIGQKLLLQMGYKPGKGLGRNLQGRVAPVEAKQRKGRGALGLYGAEHPDKQQPTKADSEEEEENDFKTKLSQWKKKPEDAKKRVKYVYKTPEEVIAEGGLRKVPVDSSQLSKVKVIDLTGPEQRILSGYHAIHQQHTRPVEIDDERSTKKYKNFTIPELTHNLGLLLDMTEQEIIRNDRELKREQDLVVNLRYEEEKLSNLLVQEEKHINITEDLLNIVETLESRTKEGASNPLALSEAADIFRRLQKDFYEQYKTYDLSNLAVVSIFPLITEYFSKWQPLKESRYGVELMKEWKDILELDSRQTYNAREMDVYHRLLWEVWMPCVRAAALEWNCRDCIPLIELLENWLPLIPPWITSNILEQLVYPRLQEEVESWNPLVDRMYIHVWIHPWLPLMGRRLEPLYNPIRQKLANAMINWHPSDDSARKILKPWVQVFPRGAMDAFVMKNILPKLEHCLKEFVINPHTQQLEPFQWVIVWDEFMPLPSFVTLMEKYFFPKWLHVLCSWLSHNPNYDEVSKWYLGWKSLFPERLMSQPSVVEQFNHALEIMNRAVSMGYPAGSKEHFDYLTSLDRQREMESQAQNMRNFEPMRPPPPPPQANVALTFKDLVEKKAEELGVIFMPIPYRLQDGKQIYRFGCAQLYIDRGVVFVQNEAVWMPTSLQALMDMAR